MKMTKERIFKHEIRQLNARQAKKALNLMAEGLSLARAIDKANPL